MAKLPCPPELWPAFSALLDEALDIPEGGRPTWLASLGREHAAVRPWLAKVLSSGAGGRESEFMNALVVDDGAPAEFTAGQPIGPYILKRRLGSGGMGEVWLASRADGTLNRQIALKLPHLHLLANVLRRRFERERDFLSALSHPHIAQLYDAGIADGLYPYLAMEWVNGVAINEHCLTRKLSLQRRLDLFLQVLEAVGYAHGRLIAHRDLKPSNILVTADNDVKLLDFGIAKLLDADAEKGATQLTRLGSCIATPAYAAPEQLTGQPITVAVDLYALGVILHELLTGQRPLREARRSAAEPVDAARASSRVDPNHARCVGGVEAKQLRRALAGDLDAIIGKALEADPAKRYSTADAFASDIKRSRENRPISARRISATTLTLKFMRRHRLGASMTAGLVLTLIGGSAGIAWQAVRAEREAQRATTIKDFLIGVFRASDPRIAADKPRGEITARELLDVSSTQIESGFAGQQDTQIELLGIVADIYRELDENKRSADLYARETELGTHYHGATDAHAIDGLLGQAFNADADGDDPRALRLLAQADPLIRQARLDKTVVRAHWLLTRGEAIMGDINHADNAEEALEGAAALFDEVAPRDARYPDALTDLGSLSLERSNFSRSAYYFRRAIAVAESNQHLQGDLLLAYAGLALDLRYLGDFAGASLAFDKGTLVAERTYGRESHYYRLIASDQAQFLYERGQRTQALERFENLVRDLPDDKTDYRNATDASEAARVLRKYGHCLAIDGQPERSIALLEKAQELFARFGWRPTEAVHVPFDLAIAYEAGGRFSEARRAFAAAQSTLQSQKAPAEQMAIVRERWGRFLLAQGDAEGASAEFLQVLRGLAGRKTESGVYAIAGMAQVHISRGDLRAALETSGRAMDQLKHIDGYYDVRIEPYVWTIRARALQLSGDGEHARVLARQAQDASLIYFSPARAPVIEAGPTVSNKPSTHLEQPNR